MNDSAAEIKRFFIQKKFRGTGISRALMTAAFDEAKKENIQTIYVATGSINERAIQFYLKYGFQEISKKELPAGYVFDPLDDRFFVKNHDS